MFTCTQMLTMLNDGLNLSNGEQGPIVRSDWKEYVTLIYSFWLQGKS